MKLSLAALNIGAIQPNLIPVVEALAHNSARAALSAATFVAITNNSGGTPGSAVVAVPTVDAKAVPTGANLASRTGFNTAIGEIDAGIANLADYLETAYVALGIDGELGAHPGVAGIAGTVAVITVGGAAVDGTAGDALLRVEANSSISRQRNNLATLVRAYNVVAVAEGVPTLSNATLGKADTGLAFAAAITATTAVAAGVVATSDLAASAATTASLTAFRDNIATIADKIDAVLLADAVTAVVTPIVLTP